MRKGVIALGIVFGSLVIAGAILARGRGQTTQSLGPTFGMSTDGIPNILEVGDIPAAMEQSRQLVAALKQNKWERSGIPFSLQRFPDQKYAENPSIRDERTAYAYIPFPDSKEYKEIAFFTDLYVRKNVLRLKNERTITKPEGFYIVGYRSGVVKQIPIGEVRLLPKHLRVQYMECFPGQEVYSPALPQLDYVANAGKVR